MQQAGPVLFSIAGRVIGGFLGGPIGSVIGGLAGGLIGSLIFNRSQKLVPDYQLMASSYGNPIPIIYGTVRLPGQVIWMDQVITKKHGLGKGMGGAAGSSPYSYWQNVMVAFCEGPADLIKIYLDGKIFLDNTQGGQEITQFKFALRTYRGDETQLPDFLYSNWVSLHVHPPTVPAYRGIAYMMFDKIDLAHFGGRFPQTTAVWSTSADFTTVFAKLTRFAGDTAGTTSAFGNGLTVDWAREIAYSLSNDGTVRAFDLRSQVQVQQNTIPTLSGIAAGSGTNLYGFGGGDFNHLDIYTINPDTLKITNTVTLATPGRGSNFLYPFLCATLTSPNGSFDMLTGNWFSGNAPYAINPQTGAYATGTMPRQNFFSSGSCCLGAQDPSNGNQDVWWTNWDFFDPTPSVYLLKATLTPAVWQQLYEPGFGITPELDTELVRQFTLADFGATSGHPEGDPIYDFTDDTVILKGVNVGSINTIKYSPAGNAIIWTSAQGVEGSSQSVLDRGNIAGAAAWVTDIDVLDTNTGLTSLSPVPPGSPGINGTFHNQVYDSYSQSLVFFGSDNEYYVAYLKRSIGAEYPVAAILQDICSRAGLNPSTDVDVTLVTDTVWGYAITDNKSAGAAIADLCHVFNYDVVESDYKLKFIPRGQPVVATITQPDLGSVDAQDFGKYWEATRTQELELPLQISLKYQDPDLDYNPGSAYAKRTALPVPTVYSKRKRALDLPIIATNVEARQVAEKWLYTMWAERDTYETVLAMKYLWLDPGDNVTVNMDNGDSYTVRIEREDVGADMSMKLALASEDLTVYSGSNSPGAQVGTLPQVIVATQFGKILLFNVPLLQDLDDLDRAQMRIYYAAGSYSAGWTNGGMYNSLNSATWNLLNTLPIAADWGYVRNTLGDTPSKFATDRVNTLVVAFSGSPFIPTSCSYDDLMNGVNPLLVGSEIIQFGDVLDNGDGTFTLSTLMRGRRGTEWATGLHTANDLFVFLEVGAIGSSRKFLAEINQLEYWRLVPSGRFLDQVPMTGFAYAGYDLKPYAPVQFSRAPSGPDLALAWKRRTRVGGYVQDGTDTIPLNEDSEAYEAYVIASAAALAAFDPTVPASYVRAFTALTAPTVTYTAAMMTADGFTPATSTLYLVVYQVSAQIGRGFQGYQALPAF